MFLKIYQIVLLLVIIFLPLNCVYAKSENNFVTIINPIRPRNLWQDDSLKNFESVRQTIDESNLKATWLIQYDVLLDQEFTNAIKGIKEEDEIGAFLEVSEQLATDARVPYLVGVGDYYRTDKVLLTGYSPQDRERLVNTYFKKFNQTFGYFPKSVGSWYIDARSQEYLEKNGVTTALTVADQYDTDGASVWGKYFAMPFYPSKFNSLEPATNIDEKIPIVNIQWAQRDMTQSYGRQITNSRHSFQANDYINNGFDFNYFETLLGKYLNQDEEFMQITIGLEIGQESANFFDEYKKQLVKLASLQSSGQITVTTASSFGNYYKNNFPNLSPSHILKDGNNYWFMSKDFRLALFNEEGKFIIKDLRFYNGLANKDYLYADKATYLDRKVAPAIDQIDKQNQLVLDTSQLLSFKGEEDNLVISMQNKQINVNKGGLFLNGTQIVKNDNQKANKSKKILIVAKHAQKAFNVFTNPLKHIKFSKIDNKQIVGFTLKNNLVGIKGIKPGIYGFSYQSIASFKSPADLLDNWQPWPI